MQKPVIFFDGVCGLCNAFVDFILRADRRQIFLFAPLQGDTARDRLPPLPEDEQRWSVAYADEAGIHEESDAALAIFRRLGGGWALLGLLRCIPRFIRNPVYRFVARNRYRWFGKKEACRLPTPAERTRFLA